MKREYHKGDPAQRFNARVERGDGCWEWRGYRFNGYGKFGVNYAYELWVGPIPGRSVVHHVCENPACVRPDHLELRDNSTVHTFEHIHDRGVVRNQYGDEWPVARTEEERKARNREWMRSKRAEEKAAAS